MLKITPKITELLFDISEIEAADNAHFLLGELTDLRNNLLKLYRVTDNQTSREKIIAIMSEAGYPWFGKLAMATQNKVDNVELKRTPEREEQLMSEEDFLNLLPANGHFH